MAATNQPDRPSWITLAAIIATVVLALAETITGNDIGLWPYATLGGLGGGVQGWAILRQLHGQGGGPSGGGGNSAA